MKKITILSAVVVAAVAMTSCHTSKESAYRKAYEKAMAQEQVIEQHPQYQQPPVTVTPLQPSTPTPNVDNVSTRQENIRVVNGAGLKAYSVVVGSFGVKANAEGLQARLNNAGNNAQVAVNENNMYRVIIGTYDSKVDAVAKRDACREQYPDAWLLYNK